MRRILPKLAIACLVSLALGLLVPGHAACLALVDGDHADHAVAAGQTEGQGQPGAGSSSSSHDHSRCAICLFASALTLPPVTGWDASRHDRVAEFPPTDAADLVAADLVLTFRGRAPPTAVA